MSDRFPSVLAERGFIDDSTENEWLRMSCSAIVAPDLKLNIWADRASEILVIVLLNPSDDEDTVVLKRVSTIADALPLIDAVIALKGLL
jgi:hypothetical protein